MTRIQAQGASSQRGAVFPKGNGPVFEDNCQEACTFLSFSKKEWPVFEATEQKWLKSGMWNSEETRRSYIKLYKDQRRARKRADLSKFILFGKRYICIDKMYTKRSEGAFDLRGPLI